MNDEQISELIYQCRKAKTGVEKVFSQDDKTYVHIVVNDRKQIAHIIRDLRMHFGFPRISRLSVPLASSAIPKVS
jgi:guanosine-3',5'-bis(diphosphate) 3'-pyrophosphohydrolase